MLMLIPKSKINNKKDESLSNLFFPIFFFFYSLAAAFQFPQSLFSYVSDNIIWEDDFESEELSGWEIIDDVSDEESNWYIDNGFLVQDTDCGSTTELLGTNIINGNPEWDDYVLRTNIICADDDYIGILFRYSDNDNYYRFLLSSQRNEIRIDKRVEGKFFNLALYDKEEWQYVRFSVAIFLYGENIKVYLNEQKIFDITDKQFNKGRIGFTSISNLGSFFDDITIYSQYKIDPPIINKAIMRGPYLQNVQKDKAIIMWDTSLPSNSVVEYSLLKNPEWIIRSDLQVVKHEIEIKNLIPETYYYYRIKSDELTAEWFSLKTAIYKDTPFSFIVYGDNQMNFLRHTEIVNQISKHDFDFIISCGDVVQRGPRSDWDVEFFEPLENILHSKPVYTAIGNHELNSENYYKNFSNPNSEHENYYSFEYGNSFFIFIDNPRAAYPDREYYTEFYPGSPQHSWIESELSSKKAQNVQWIFVISHIPSYVAGTQSYFSACNEYLVPLFEKYGVDFSFSGHVHGYERGLVNGVNYIITAGGGGPLNKKGSAILKQFKNFQQVYNFCRIDVNDNKISFKAFDISNNIIDSFDIIK